MQLEKGKYYYQPMKLGLPKENTVTICSDGRVIAEIDGVRKVVTLARLSEALTNLEAAQMHFGIDMNTPYPRGTRLYREFSKSAMYIIEVEPGIQTLRLGRTYEVAMPWQYFIITFNRIYGPPVKGVRKTFSQLGSIRVLWSKTRMNSMASSMIVARIPNVRAATALLCLGTTAPSTGLSEAERIDELMQFFYSRDSKFNVDLGRNLPNHYRGFAVWQRESAVNPFVWKKWSDWNTDRIFTPAMIVMRGISPPPTTFLTLYQELFLGRDEEGPKW